MAVQTKQDFASFALIIKTFAYIHMKNFLNPYALSAVAGLIYPFAFAPFNLFPCAIISISLLCYLLLKQNRVFLLAFIFALTSFGTGIAWVYISLWKYGNAHWFFAVLANIFLVLYLSLYPALAAVFAKKFSAAESLDRALLLAGFLSLAEILRAYIFSGFPWLALGYSQNNMFFKALAPIGGVFFLGFVVYLLCSLLAFAIISKKK